MKKFENFCRAFANLKLIYREEEPYGVMALVAIVGLFDICFEQAWKAMKERLQAEGFPAAATGSPRQVLKTAYQAGLIEDEELWLSALAARNNEAHAYNEEIALSIAKDVKERFYPMFDALKEKLEERE